MNRKFLKGALALIAVAAFVILAMREGQTTAEARWLTSMPEALALAKSTNKPILIDFQAEWCGPCHMMSDEVFAKRPFKDQAGRWVLLQIDVDKQGEIAARYGASSLPSLVVLSVDGKPVIGSKGYRGPEYTMAFINEAYKQSTQSQPLRK